MGNKKITGWKRWDGVPQETMEFAKRRTHFLTQSYPMSVQTIPTALANAYLQGIADCAEVVARMDKNEK